MSRQREDRTLTDHIVGFLIYNVVGLFTFIMGMTSGFSAGTLTLGLGGLVYYLWDRGVRRRLARAIRINRGKCADCGYDLCESAGVCPECGAAIPQDHRRHSDVIGDLEKM